jgi:hypothetical protein
MNELLQLFPTDLYHVILGYVLLEDILQWKWWLSDRWSVAKLIADYQDVLYDPDNVTLENWKQIFYHIQALKTTQPNIQRIPQGTPMSMGGEHIFLSEETLQQYPILEHFKKGDAFVISRTLYLVDKKLSNGKFSLKIHSSPSIFSWFPYWRALNEYCTSYIRMPANMSQIISFPDKKRLWIFVHHNNVAYGIVGLEHDFFVSGAQTCVIYPWINIVTQSSTWISLLAVYHLTPDRVYMTSSLFNSQKITGPISTSIWWTNP